MPLGRWRARLGRGRRLRRSDELLESADAAGRIRGLPPDEFYWLLREVGLPEAGGLLRHATAEQIQVAIDFDAWDRDRILPGRLAEWTAAIAGAPPDKIGEWARGLDIEVLAWLLVTAARVYDLGTEEPPDEPQGTFWPTPDRFFVIDVFGRVDLGVPPLLHILDALYRSDKDLARRILVGTRGELASDLEETAYRWRCGRMADLGFADYYEALEVFRELDPGSVRIGESALPRLRPLDEGPGPAGADAGDALRSPGALIQRLRDGRGPFSRAVSGLATSEDLADLHFALVALTNRVLGAERVAPGDDAAVRAAIQGLEGTLDLAVEFLARGAPAFETEAVRTVSLVRLHRLGVSVVAKLARLARALRGGGPFAAPRASGRPDIWEQDDGAILGAVDRARPLFPRLLETPPRAGDRPFASLDDIARATAAIERAGAAVAMLAGLGVRAEHLAPERLGPLQGGEAAVVDTGTIARTVLVARILRRAEASFSPLAPTDVARFAALGKKGAGLPALAPRIRARAQAILRDAAPARLGADAVRAVTERWLASLLPLEPVLVRAAPPRGRQKRPARPTAIRNRERAKRQRPAGTRRRGKRRRA